MTAPAHTAAPLRDGPRTRRRVRVDGIVQGVGFRPFVHSLATRLALEGSVWNDGRGVVAEVEGSSDAVRSFLEALSTEAPPLAVIEGITDEPLPPTGETGFVIVESRTAGERHVAVSPDVATCDECLREIHDPHDRRYRYPFTNCTHCGPRFTIVRDVPYDRSRTTMGGFAMCADCAREYEDPGNRRFHAQPTCCPACGPRLRLTDAGGGERSGDPIGAAASALRSGAILAVKGLGGYHLAALASDEEAVARLRSRKHREEKPFAVMVPDLGAAARLGDLEGAEARLLESPERPIVLVRRRPGARLAPAVAPSNRRVGLLLPYTPIHHLLLEETEPIVLTSGNASDEPIAYHDTDAFGRLGRIADFFLTHDRPIHVRTDDSVVRIVRGREMPVRRSRGYAPRPLRLPTAARRPILACGAELKNTFCLARDGTAYVSHHVGDLENFETLVAFREGIEHYRRLFSIDPEIVAYDLHPEYLSTKYALDLTGVEHVGIQHHHAHVAACLAENAEPGPAIGVAFDGLGFGLDGTIWGGEILVASLAGFERVAAFEPVAMPGGEAAVREPWRMALAYLRAAYGGDLRLDLDVFRRNQRHWKIVDSVATRRVGSPKTSSVGRLFDAVAALLGVRDRISYEGQAAIELEQRASLREGGAYLAGLGVDSRPARIRGVDFVRAVVDDLRDGAPVSTVAARFHNGLAETIGRVCAAVRDDRRLSTVALSGGVFQNELLLERTIATLERLRFRVLVHSRVPTNDGGISFGQTAITAARDVSQTIGETETAPPERPPPGPGADLRRGVRSGGDRDGF